MLGLLSFFKTHSKLYTIQQEIKRLKVRFFIFLGIVVASIITIMSVFASEFSRVSNYYFNQIAETRMSNSGTQRKNYVETHIQMAFQDIVTLRAIVDANDILDENYNVSDTKINNLLKDSSTYPYFLDDVGVILKDRIIFDAGTSFSFKKFDITKNMMLKGYEINTEDNTDSNLYFIIPASEHSQLGVEGFIGKIETETFTQAISTTIYNNESTTLIVRDNGDIICFSSGVHRWRFDNFEGKKFTNLTVAMHTWVSSSEYDSYLDFMLTRGVAIFNAGKDDRDGMFYKDELVVGDEYSHYVMIFMAPKYLLTNQTESLAQTAAIAFYITLLLGTIVSIALASLLIHEFLNRKRENSFDKNTGLHKDEAFFHDAQALLLQHQTETYGLVFMNIKGFTRINSFFGSIAGDRILDQVGKKVQETVEEGPYDIAGYLTGDKYMLFLKGDYDEVLYKLNELNQKLINTQFEYGQKLTFSYGTKMTASINALDLRDELELAKYSNKINKDNEDVVFHLFDEEMISMQKERNELNNRFEEALDKKEFEVFLQLKWDLKKNDWAGAEALCRWRDPIKGLISPGRFIPLFEENGKIVKLDLYMFEETCKIIREMLDNGERCVPVSFNLSKRNFQDSTFFNKYQEIIEQYQIPHDLIEVEITEGLLVDNIETFTSVIKIFHENEFNISMDDFGAGYSSLNMIHELDFDVIKIDAKFFRGGFDEANQIIVSSIINLCHRLNKIVVAEGIEHTSEVDFLKEAGCDIIQGYYFAKPLPVEEFKELLLRNENQ